MEKAKREAHVKSFMSVLIAGLFFGAMFVSLVPLEVVAPGNEPSDKGGGIWENDDTDPLPWIITNEQKFTSRTPTPSGWNYCIEMTIHSGITISNTGTLILEGVDLIIAAESFPPYSFMIESGGKLILNGTGSKSTTMKEEDGDYYPLTVAGTLEVKGDSPTRPVDIKYVGGEIKGIIFLDGAVGIFENCSISDVEYSAIICNSGSKISFNNTNINFDGNDEPGVLLDGCEIKKFENTLIKTTSANTEEAIKFKNIPESDNVEVHNSTFIGAFFGVDVNTTSSEFQMHNCKFMGSNDGFFKIWAESSTLHLIAPSINHISGEIFPAVYLESGSEIYVYWYLNATVHDQNMVGLEGVKIEASSTGGGPQNIVGYTNSIGKLLWLPLQQLKIFGDFPNTNQEDYSEYFVEATYFSDIQDKMVIINGKWDQGTSDEVDVDTLEFEFDTRPDLIVSDVSHFAYSSTPDECYEGDLINVTATIENIGHTGTWADVSFYDGNPDEGGVILNATNGKKHIYLEESGKQDTVDVSVNWSTKLGDIGEHLIWIIVNNSKGVGGNGDANWTDNNWTDYSIIIKKIGADFLTQTITFWNDLKQEVTEVLDGENVTIIANITNIGRLEGSANVNFYNNGTISEDEKINENPIQINLDVGESINVSVTWNTLWQGNGTETRDIIVNILNITYDMNISNNKAQKQFTVKTYRNIELELISNGNQSVIKGTSAIYDMFVKNYGRTIENIDISYEVVIGNNSKWTIDEPTTPITNLKHNKTKQISLQVIPKLSSLPQPGEYIVINVTGKSQYNSTIKSTVTTNTTYGQPDLTLTKRTRNITFYREHSDEEVSKSGKSLIVNESSTIQATIENIGIASTGKDILVRFYNDSIDKQNPKKNVIGNFTITGGLAPDMLKTASIKHVFNATGKYNIWVWVDPEDKQGGEIKENNEENNIWNTTINVKSKIPTSTFNLHGYVYDMDGKVVENANVTILSPYKKTKTDDKGYYSITLNQQEYEEGKELDIIATHPTDPSKATEEINAYSEDSPYELDLYLKIEGIDLEILTENIKFYREKDRGEINEPIYKEYTSITATIRNRGTEDAKNFFVNFTWGFEKLKNGFKIKIDVPARGTITIKDIVPTTPVEECVNAVLFITPGGGFPEVGKHTIKVEISNSSGGKNDAYKDNNYAFRTVRVKDKTPMSSLHIYGTIYDSERNIVSNAVVNITNQNPDLKFSTEIETDGKGDYSYYLINYQEGDKIVLTARGKSGSGTQSFYAYSEDKEVRKDIMFDKYDVELRVDDKNKDTDNNLMAEYLVEVENIGTKVDAIKLEIDNPSLEWHAWFNETGNSTLIIERGRVIEVKLFVKAPSPGKANAYEKLSITINATSPNGSFDKLIITTDINPKYLLPYISSSDTMSKSAKPGKTETYNFTISNNGNWYDTIYVELSGDVNWASPVSPVTLAPKGSFGDTKTFTLKVTVPLDAFEGKEGKIDVCVFGKTGEKTTPIPTTTTAEKVDKAPTLSITPNARNVDPGMEATYSVRVTNNGNGDSRIRISRVGSGDFKVRIDGNTLPYVIDVGKGKTVELSLGVTPQSDKLAEDFETVTLKATVVGTNFESYPASTVTKVNYVYADPEIKFEDGETSKIDETLIQGDSKIYNIRVKNNGNFKDTMFTFLSGDVSWASPISSISLDAKDEGIVKLSITVPKTEIAGKEATINITTTSGKSGLVSNEISLKIIVKEGYSVKISSVNNIISKEINRGECAVYGINVTNTGKLQDKFILKVEQINNPGGKWNIEQALINVGVLDKNGSKTDSKIVNVLVNVPNDAPFENYKIKVYAISETHPNVKSEEKELTTIIHKPPEPSGIQVDVTEFYTNTDITFSVEDRGNNYTWNFGDGSKEEKGAKVIHKFSLPGTYIVVLTSEDSMGAKGQSIKPIEVINKEPDVKITKPKTHTKAGINEDIEFVGSVEDINGFIEYVIWDFGDGNKISQIEPKENITVKHFYLKPSSYNVTLTAKDDLGAIVISEPITIIIENKPPEANFSVGKGVFEINNEILFNGSTSSDPDGKIVSWYWDFGDGTTGTGPNPTHTYTKDGKYDVKLTVTDENGVTASYSTTIEIFKPEEKSYTLHWIISIIFVAILFVFIVGILFGGREEFFSKFNARIKEGLAEKKAREEKKIEAPEIEEKIKKLENLVEERIKTPPSPPKMIETPAGILEEVKPGVKELEEVGEVEEGLLEEVSEVEEEGKLRPTTIDELSEAFAATLVNLARGREELAKIEEKIAETLKEERDRRAAEIRKITKDYELTQRKIEALEELARMRRMQAGEEKIAAIFRGEIPEEEEEEEFGALEEIEEEPLGELEEIGEEYEEEMEEELMEEDLETLEEEELLEDLEELEEEEEPVEEGEMAECGACGAMIPIDATKCPKCGAEFEE